MHLASHHSLALLAAFLEVLVASELSDREKSSALSQYYALLEDMESGTMSNHAVDMLLRAEAKR